MSDGGRHKLVIALGILLACCRCALALDPSLDINQYAHTAWRIREGFAAGTVQQIAQTRDGYLWLATESGLLRFDGIRTVPWEPPPGEHLPSNEIRGLLAARDGTLWIGTAKGLVSWKDGKLTHYPELDGYDVFALLEDHEGTLWTGGAVWESTGPGKLCAIKPGNTQCDGKDGTFGYGVTALYENSRGNLWLGAGTGLWRWKPGPPKHYAMPELTTGLLPYLHNSLTEGEHGELLIARPHGVKQLVDEKLEPYPFPGGAPQINGGKLLRDRHGSLWIGTIDTGLLHVHQGRMDAFVESDGLSGNSVQSLFEDREGNIWVGTTSGFDRFREYAIPTISVKQGLSNPVVLCVLAARDGSVWLGTRDGLNRWKNGQVTIYRKANPGAKTRQSTDAMGSGAGRGAERPDATVHEVMDSGLPDNYVYSLAEDTQGRIWVTTHGPLGYFENGRFVSLNAARFKWTGWTGYLTADSAGNIWITNTESGLYRFRGRELVEYFPWAKLGIRGASSNPLVMDTVNGGLWLGSWGGGVVYFKDSQVRASYGPDAGLGAGRVNSVQVDSNGALWAGTEGGLSRIKNGRVITLTSKNGLPCDSALDVLEDDAHSLWLSMACGLVRIARPELDAWVADPQRRIQATVFDNSDGVRSHAIWGATPHVAKTADGKLWFLPNDGVMVVDPYHLPSNKFPPPVRIEQITADGKVYTPAAGSRRLRLPPLVHDLTIDYTGLSFVAPEKVHFRFKLEGQDKDWREVVNQRRVEYSNLPPGNYRFRLIACNNSGVWNEKGDELDFSVAPAYYQTNWFRALCAAIFLAMLWALYQYRLHQVAQEFNLGLEARVSERTRIARELHDTLLQSFHGLLLRLQAVANVLPEGEAKKRLESTIDQAAQAITEGRDAVQGLRSSTVETNDLALAVSALGDELAADETNGNSAVLHVGVEGTPRNLHPILRDEVYRIAGEALRNASRHAQARRIEVEIRYDERQLRLRVRDDGKGIDPKVLSGEGRAGHFGLRNMRERAKLVGGQLDVWSEVDTGTEVELSIPAAIAYAKAPPRRSWFTAKS